MKDLSARELILTLIDSATATTMSAKYFVAVGELFGMDAGSIRVALARLVRDGSLNQVERGSYCLGTRSGTLHSMVRSWAKVEDTVKPWSGAWLAALTQHLPRGNKTSLRSRERALRLYGFAPSDTGLWVRPDNLRADTSRMHQALCELGLDQTAVLSTLAGETPPGSIASASLWQPEKLEAGYGELIATLADSTARLATYGDDEAAQETLMVGRLVTRAILLDPLLPCEMVNTQLRGNMIKAMRAYDRQGKAYFRALFFRHK